MNSIANDQEVDDVVNYVKMLVRGEMMTPYIAKPATTGQRKKLKPIGMEEIGVIASYRAQCKVLRDRFQREPGDWSGLKIGSVDSFQGEEKTVIIASTVRSKSENAAFLNDPKVSKYIYSYINCNCFFGSVA